MAEVTTAAAGGPPIAVVGLACRFPDADDPPALLETILTGRRAFRRLPPCRVDLSDYYSPDPSTPDATYSTRAALLEGWQFDRDAFGVSPEAYTAADPAHWLALETVARALAGAGFPGGRGLNRDRVGVIIGNSLGGDSSRAGAMRLRWPYVRRAVAEALFAAEVPADQAAQVLRLAAARYLEPFPRVGDQSLAGAMPGSIGARICGHFGFRGGAHAVDGASASSLLAVTAACTALTAGDLDMALAGGVDISLDPLELVGMAKTGALATGEMRVYDENPTGYLPGEGCGVVILMRTADARAADLPVYAEITGWGTSAAGQDMVTAAGPDGQLLALRRAYERAATDPADVQLIEGHGSGTGPDDEAEITALSQLRAGARVPAALGSIKANIGHTKAAAGSAGLIKTVLALGTGIVPPATGVSAPHPMLREDGGSLVLPRSAREWPEGIRIAGVSAMDPGGISVHLVLRNEPGRSSRLDRIVRSLPRIPRAEPGRRASPDAFAPRAADGAARTAAYLLHAADAPALAAILTRIADIAPFLSDAEMQDLACHLARQITGQGPVRVAIVASTQEQLARLASESLTLLSRLAAGLLTVRPGIFASDGADGRVTLLLSDEDCHAAADGATAGDPAAVTDPAAVMTSLAALRWLDLLGVRATAAVGHGQGFLAGLAWAGCITDDDAAMLGRLRAEIRAQGGRPEPKLEASSAAGTTDAAPLRAAVDELKLGPPKRRLISTRTGRELAASSEIADLLCGDVFGPELSGAELGAAVQAGRAPEATQALRAGAVGASVLLETGPGRALIAAATRICQAPAVSLAAGPDDNRDAARAAAALFAAGALIEPAPLFAGRTARPFDIWREQVFITSPCQAIPSQPAPLPARAHQGTAALAGPPSRPGAGQAQHDRQASATRLTDTTGSADVPVSADEIGDHDQAERQQSTLGIVTLTVTGPGTGETDAPAGRTVRQAAERDDAMAIEHGRPAEPQPEALPEAEPEAEPEPAPRPPADQQPQAPDLVAGVGPWVRCYGEELRLPLNPPPHRGDSGSGGPWRVRTGGRLPFSVDVSDLFPDDPEAGQVLVIVGDPAEADSCAAIIGAVRSAMSVGRLVVITPEPALDGFWAALHAEHPSLGLTVLRVPASADGLRAARPFAAATPGEFRQLVINAAGTPQQPVMTPVELPGGGPLPLGADDVVLLSRGAQGAGLALAQVFACCGAPVAVIGRPDPGEDPQLAAGLEQLAGAGARIACEVVDLADAAKMDAALQRIEQQLGPVTVVGLAVAASEAAPLATISEAQARRQVAAEAAALGQVLSAVQADRLRLIATFGSVAGHYGLAGTGLQAMASASLAQQAARLADSIPGCRALHVDVPAWSPTAAERTGAGPPAVRAGLDSTRIDAIGIGEASRLLLKVLGSAAPHARLAVHGRVGVPAPAAIGAAAPQAPRSGRFLETVTLDYPGVELISEAYLSLRTDPYLADYRVDGIPVLPPVMALEAMAEVAAALAGRPLRRAAAVSMDAPVVIPAAAAGGRALIRICALRSGGTVQVVLRCAESGWRVDHYRASFRSGDAADGAAALNAVVLNATGTDGTAAGAPEEGTAVDGAGLYGPLYFPSGRFRRIAALPEVTPRSCRAVARGADDQPWFSGAAEPGADLILGSPGLADATLHLVQACVPHRRLLPAGCESVEFSGRAAEGTVLIRAVTLAGSGEGKPPKRKAARGAAPASNAPASDVPAQQPTAGAAADPAGAVPQQASSPEAEGETSAAGADHGLLAQVWDIEAVDDAGPLVAWRGVRMRDAGPQPRCAAWPPALLAVYLEQVSGELGLGPDLRVNVRRVTSDTGAGPAAGPAPGARSAAGSGQLAGLVLTVSAAGAAACGWSAAGSGQVPPQEAGHALAEARARMFSRFLGEPRGTVSARLRAIQACLSMSGAPVGCPIVVRDIADDGWVLLSAAGADMACTVVELAGVASPVAVALMTGTPRMERRKPGRAERPAGHRSRSAASRA
ncbi:MAG: beta-ketoacyl synthase N-terminal-like domain-containing protein [Streptosporangiaceae bacterium]